MANEIVAEIGRRVLVGFGRVGARALARAQASVLGDVREFSREIESRAGAAQARLEELLGQPPQDVSQAPKHRR